MVAWWNAQSSHKKSIWISVIGGVLSLVSLYGVPYLNSIGTPVTVAVASVTTYAVALAQRNLLTLQPPADGQATNPAS